MSRVCVWASCLVSKSMPGLRDLASCPILHANAWCQGETLDKSCLEGDSVVPKDILSPEYADRFRGAQRRFFCEITYLIIVNKACIATMSCYFGWGRAENCPLNTSKTL